MTDKELNLAFHEFVKDNPIMSDEELETIQTATKAYVTEKLPWVVETGYGQLADELKLKYYESYMSGGRTMKSSIYSAMDSLSLYLNTLVSEEIIQSGVAEDIMNIFKNRFLERSGDETA